MMSHIKTGIFIIMAAGLFACSKSSDPYAAYKNGDFDTARKGFISLAERGDLNALTHLGVIYQIGLDTEKNYAMAAKYYEEAASKGNAPAQYNLGLMHYEGIGMAKDHKKAFKWLSLAAEQEHSKAKKLLGHLVGNRKGSQITD